jgi:uncharacterized protein YkwD
MLASKRHKKHMQAGKIMLLTLVFLLMSKATLHAQGNAPLPIMKAQTEQSCTAFTSYFVVNDNSCIEKRLTQTEKAVKAAVSDDGEANLPVFSYSTESVYFVEPTPTPNVEETPTPAPLPDSATIEGARDMVPQTGVNVDANVIFDLINSHRTSIGKPAFIKDEALCSLATTRSMELSGEFANGTLHSGLYNRNLPYWITEDAKWGSNEAGTLRWWLNSPIHRAAIEGNHVYSCGACNGSQCSQLFTSYTPKQIPIPTALPVAPQD